MKNRRIHFKSEKGLSFVEVLLSVALLAIIAGPLLGAVYASFSNNIAAKDKTEAVALAERVMEEIKAQGTIGETDPDKDPEYTVNTSANLKAYYAIENIDKTTPGGIVSPSTESAYTYTNDLVAANKVDFELELDQGNIAANGTVNADLYTVDNADDTRTQVKLVSGIKIIGDILEFKLTKDGSGNKYYFDKISQPEAESSFNIRDNTNNIVRLKVKYKNAQTGSVRKLKIHIYSDNTDLNIYEEQNTQSTSGVNFINKGKRDFQVIYLDTQNVFDYKPINGLYMITVSIKKKNSSDVIYQITSYVKKNSG